MKAATATQINPNQPLTPREVTSEVRRRGIKLGIVKRVRVAILTTNTGYVSAAADTSHAAVEELLRKIGGAN